MLHGCRIGDRVLIGMGTIILDDTVVSGDVMIAQAASCRRANGWKAAISMSARPSNKSAR